MAGDLESPCFSYLSYTRSVSPSREQVAPICKRRDREVMCDVRKHHTPATPRSVSRPPAPRPPRAAIELPNRPPVPPHAYCTVHT